ncbi:MAG: TIGR03087 family PEP-CTERM/XrtA system glycosyltransferase [Gammaproteobacteria bacterium]|nr:TIGR03087 family PEP-CTERM/XrtA system glycosyltransferase [Gammaproteobacteria bacterium]
MPPLLYLCHRIPFPPNKGDKIATFNLLKFLAKHYQIHLGYFIDDPFDQQYIKELVPYCASSFELDICDRRQAVSGVKALLMGESISTTHYHSKQFQAWVDQTIKQHNIQKFFVYSSAMAQFIDHPRYKKNTRILNMTDIDSDKWRQYALAKPWYSKWIYNREHHQLAKFEQKILQHFDVVTLVTEQEKQLFCQMSPSALTSKIHTVTNGVDTDYFNPDAQFDKSIPQPLMSPALCFTGAMDYWANVDAMVWFCQQVWPLVRAKHPQCQFYIVGGNPPKKVTELAILPGVIVTGRVPDVRPYVAHANVVVAPMKIARGVQNKVLEAMSMAKAVVMTTMAQEGINTNDNQQALVHDDANDMASCINDLLDSPNLDFTENRQWILKYYSWDGALLHLPQLINARYS